MTSVEGVAMQREDYEVLNPATAVLRLDGNLAGSKSPAALRPVSGTPARIPPISGLLKRRYASQPTGFR
jgi:hypothetical protein